MKLKSTIFLSLLALITPLYIFADENRFIDSAIVKAKYEKIMLKDTIDREKLVKVFELTLFASNKGSAFYSEELRAEEELPFDLEWVKRNFGPEKTGKTIADFDAEKIFRIYAENKSIEHKLFNGSSWELKEEIEKPVWEIQDSTQNILGIECVKAVTDFRGRKWIAWFAPEIPVSEGPWKLWGLPGLILKTYDVKRHYSYEAKEIDTQNPGIVEFFETHKNRFIIRNREKGLKNQRKYLYSDFRRVIKGLLGDKAPDMKPMNKSVYYDFQEIDYEHVPIESYNE